MFHAKTQAARPESRRRVQLTACDQPLDSASEPPLGAHLITPRRGYTHHGIYVGAGHVVQYGGLSSGLRLGPVEEVSLSQFAQGRPLWLRAELARVGPSEVVSRARSRLGENRYHVLKNNCEHFCEWCVRGEHRSYQIDELSLRYFWIRQKWVELVASVFLHRQTSMLTKVQEL